MESMEVLKILNALEINLTPVVLSIFAFAHIFFCRNLKK